MPFVTFQTSDGAAPRLLEVKAGTTLFDAALRAGLPVASSCNADSVCGKCNMQVVEGGENLSSASEHEGDLLTKENNPPTDRISCLTKVLGDCKVTTRYW